MMLVMIVIMAVIIVVMMAVLAVMRLVVMFVFLVMAVVTGMMALMMIAILFVIVVMAVLAVMGILVMLVLMAVMMIVAALAAESGVHRGSAGVVVTQERVFDGGVARLHRMLHPLREALHFSRKLLAGGKANVGFGARGAACACNSQRGDGERRSAYEEDDSGAQKPGLKQFNRHEFHPFSPPRRGFYARRISRSSARGVAKNIFRDRRKPIDARESRPVTPCADEFHARRAPGGFIRRSGALAPSPCN